MHDALECWAQWQRPGCRAVRTCGLSVLADSAAGRLLITAAASSALLACRAGVQPALPRKQGAALACHLRSLLYKQRAGIGVSAAEAAALRRLRAAAPPAEAGPNKVSQEMGSVAQHDKQAKGHPFVCCSRSKPFRWMGCLPQPRELDALSVHRRGATGGLSGRRSILGALRHSSRPLASHGLLSPPRCQPQASVRCVCGLPQAPAS